MGQLIKLSSLAERKRAASPLHADFADLRNLRPELFQKLDSQWRVAVEQLLTAVTALDRAATKANALSAQLTPGSSKEIFEVQLRNIVEALGNTRAETLRLASEVRVTTEKTVLDETLGSGASLTQFQPSRLTATDGTGSPEG
jgi:hypothetical protein